MLIHVFTIINTPIKSTGFENRKYNGLQYWKQLINLFLGPETKYN